MFALMLLGCLVALLLYIVLLWAVTDESRELVAQRLGKRKGLHMFTLDNIKTGPDLERTLQTRFVSGDWQAQLAARSGLPQEEVMLQLRRNSAPSEPLLTAARGLLEDAAEAQKDGSVTTGSPSMAP